MLAVLWVDLTSITVEVAGCSSRYDGEATSEEPTVTFQTDSVPDPTRSDVGAPMFSTWRVGTPERQRATVEAVTAAWDAHPWPTPGLCSYAVFAGGDGDTLLHYSQWADEDAYWAFVRNGRDARTGEVFAAVPEIERVELVGYRLYRSTHPATEATAPGCFVTVTVEFDEPDAKRQQEWVDGVFDGAEKDPRPQEGLIAAHFHLSTDGARVLNFAEWTSEQAHRDAVEAPGGGARTAATDFPGVKSLTFERFHLQLHLTDQQSTDGHQ